MGGRLGWTSPPHRLPRCRTRSRWSSATGRSRRASTMPFASRCSTALKAKTGGSPCKSRGRDILSRCVQMSPDEPRNSSPPTASEVPCASPVDMHHPLARHGVRCGLSTPLRSYPSLPESGRSVERRNVVKGNPFPVAQRPVPAGPGHAADARLVDRTSARGRHRAAGADGLTARSTNHPPTHSFRHLNTLGLVNPGHYRQLLKLRM